MVLGCLHLLVFVNILFLGFTKHHNGTDFAAPTGTPIMASGNGTVIKAGWCGNGGNCVRIRHNSSYTTGYGHLSKFATKTGRRVRQGQIIGYVEILECQLAHIFTTQSNTMESL